MTSAETTALKGPMRPQPSQSAEVLALCSLASEPYDRFVWDHPPRAQAIALLLWEAGAGEVTTETTLVWQDEAGVAGVLVTLEGRSLRRARLAAALTLSRQNDITLTDSERTRAGLAATTLPAVPPDALYLARIAVDPQWRGRGVARRMLDALFLREASLPDKAVYLEVKASNEAAIALYLSAGFESLKTLEVEADGGRQLHFLQMRAIVGSAQSR